MDEDTRIVDTAVACLAEHFDTVQVFVSRHDGTTGTLTISRGAGNVCARHAQAREWSIRQDAANWSSAVDDYDAEQAQHDDEEGEIDDV